MALAGSVWGALRQPLGRNLLTITALVGNSPGLKYLMPSLPLRLPSSKAGTYSKLHPLAMFHLSCSLPRDNSSSISSDYSYPTDRIRRFEATLETKITFPISSSLEPHRQAGQGKGKKIDPKRPMQRVRLGTRSTARAMHAF